MSDERSSLGDLPEPKPLYDPLLAARPVLLGLFVISIGISLWRVIPNSNLWGWIAVGVAAVIQLAVLLALPKRPVDALYLRAFGDDDASFDARLLIEAVLHPDYRLSGIRAPRRRMPLIMRPFLFGLFAARYLGTRYMSLEAESDWLARLWKTLSTVRVVFVDLRNLTPNLFAEARLALECVGIGRTVFVVDEATGTESIAAIAEQTGAPVDTLNARAVIWRGRDADEIERFMTSVAKLVKALPAQAAGVAWNALDLVREHTMDRATARKRRLVDMTQWVLGFGVVIAAQFVDSETGARIATAIADSAVARILLVSLSGLIVIPGILALSSLFRRRPYERAIRRRSRGVLLRSFAGTTRALTAASLAFGLAFHFGLEMLGKVALSQLSAAQVLSARVDMRSLENGLQLYRLNNTDYPASLDDLRDYVSETSLIDPWGRPYEYELVDGQVRFWSRGPDAISGTGDDVDPEF